jgi:hypothetical protein
LTLRQCALDTGYDVAETQAILKRMYPKLDSKTQPLYLYLLKWVAAEPKAEAPVAPSLNYTGLAIATFKETFKEYQIANNLEAYEIDFTQKSKETGHMRLLSERFLALLKSAAPPTNQPIEEATFKSRLKGFLSECLRQKAAGKWFASDFLPSRIYANFDLIITESRGYNKKVKEAAKAAHHQLEDYDAIELKK